MKQIEYIGAGALENISAVLSERKPTSVLLVTGNESYATSGAEARMTSILEGYKHVRFCGFQPNPKLEDVERGLKCHKENDCDFIIAVGGGTAMDLAKTVGMLAKHDGSPRDYVTGKLKFDDLTAPLIAVPTTAGSGSEATQFAVLYVDGVKSSIAHQCLLPFCSVVDYTLMQGMSPYLTAVSGMDALAQAVESYWAVGANEESKEYAAEAIRVILSSIEDAVAAARVSEGISSPLGGEDQGEGAIDNRSELFSSPLVGEDQGEGMITNSTARESMALGANLAGKAINITRTTASHAMGYILTTTFDLPHGHAVAITLPHVLLYNSTPNDEDIVDPRGVKYVEKTMADLLDLLDVDTPEQGRDMLMSLLERIGVANQFRKLGVSHEDIGGLVAGSINWEKMSNNPRRLTEDSVRELIEAIG